jgi:hypothetical protein
MHPPIVSGGTKPDSQEYDIPSKHVTQLLRDAGEQTWLWSTTIPEASERRAAAVSPIPAKIRARAVVRIN